MKKTVNKYRVSAKWIGLNGDVLSKEMDVYESRMTKTKARFYLSDALGFKLPYGAVVDWVHIDTETYKLDTDDVVKYGTRC